MTETRDFLTLDDLQNFRDVVRKDATERAAKWTIGAVLALIGFAAAGWWFYFKPYLIDIFGGVPAGTVAAFDREGCPNQWEPFDIAAGRFVLGVGQGEGLTKRRYRDLSPPTESVRLSEINIPAHQHETMIGINEEGAWGYGRTRRVVGGVGWGNYSPALSSPYGKAIPEPISIMPPFIALQFCKKV